ncbi:hypothetical protein RIF29_00366 [Crotalaria pallida]|uniref:Uncharacterized protein n=1 Tax=Crotalaria pallida TaxID=3830 RepID=A0AAN9P7E2_CROPI
MEDGLTEVQSLLHPQSLNQEDESKREDNKEKRDEFVSIGNVEKVKEEDHSEKDTGKGCVGSDGDVSGGLFNNLISSLVTPSSPRIDEKVPQHESGNEVFNLEEGTIASSGEKRRVESENGGEGGLISNFVSNFFHQSEGEGGVVDEKEKEEEKDVIVEKIKRVKTEEMTNGGGGSIIDNIVSHLHPSLPGKHKLDNIILSLMAIANLFSMHHF